VKGPLISIIIPCYNQGKYLAAAIESVLGQGYPRCEIIVVNDGSSDDTEQVASGFDARITYIRKANFGRSAARNTGILAARGDYVICLDADDLFGDGMLQSMAQAASEFPETDVFVGGWRDLVAGKMGESVIHLPIPKELFHGLLAGNLGVIHCFMVRRDVLANSGLFDVNLSAAEDWDLWIRLAAAQSSFRAVSNAIAIYRRYPESSTADYEHVMRSTELMLNRNSLIHTNCAKCRAAAKSGWQAHFDAYVVPGSLKELVKLKKARQHFALLSRICELSLRYPSLLKIFLQVGLRKREKQ
jgi:glycosyltransferase involved in cell wall biosynthesis